MHIAKENDSLRITFNFVEGRVLQRILGEVLREYQVKPEQMDAKTAGAWYSTRGCATAKMSAEETREWLEALHSFKGANVRRLEEWVGQLAKKQAGSHHLELKLDDAPRLITALNDHRLLAAARHDIGPVEMAAHSASAIARLPAARQTALYQIHFLAFVIEELLRTLPDNCTDWHS